MRICTQCGHRLSHEEFLCPACELWDSKSYKEPRSQTRRRTRKVATVFIGPLQHALLVRQICEDSGIPAYIDAERGASAKLVRVQVPAERVQEASGLLSGKVEAEDGEEEDARGEPSLRVQRSSLRARLSLRKKSYQALAWAVVALVFPPAGLVAGKLALSVLAENRSLPVVTEEARVATASLIIASTAMLLCGVLAWLIFRN